MQYWAPYVGGTLTIKGATRFVEFVWWENVLYQSLMQLSFISVDKSRKIPFGWIKAILHIYKIDEMTWIKMSHAQQKADFNKIEVLDEEAIEVCVECPNVSVSESNINKKETASSHRIQSNATRWVFNDKMYI